MIKPKLEQLEKGTIVKLYTSAIHQGTRKPLDGHIARVNRIVNENEILCYVQLRGLGYILPFSLDELLINPGMYGTMEVRFN